MDDSVLTDKQRFWLEHIRKHKDSGIARTDYCRLHKLNADHMSHFHSYIRRHYPSLLGESGRNNLIPVKTTSQEIRLTLANGVSIALPASPALVAQVIKALT